MEAEFLQLMLISPYKMQKLNYAGPTLKITLSRAN